MGKSIKIDNAKEVTINCIVVDGCAITQGRRCDYLFIIGPNRYEVFVELKGNKVEKAAAQLQRSIELLTQNKGAAKVALIVASKCPAISSKLQKFKLQFKKNFNATLMVKNRTCTHKA